MTFHLVIIVNGVKVLPLFVSIFKFTVANLSLDAQINTFNKNHAKLIPTLSVLMSFVEDKFHMQLLLSLLQQCLVGQGSPSCESELLFVP